MNDGERIKTEKLLTVSLHTSFNKMKKQKRAVKCKHDLVFVEHFSRIMENNKIYYRDTYRFICKKPDCLAIVDVTKDGN